MSTVQRDSSVWRAARDGRGAIRPTRGSSRSSRGPGSSRAAWSTGSSACWRSTSRSGRAARSRTSRERCRSVEQHSFGHVLLTLLAVGLGGYALWRLFRAAPRPRPRGRRPRDRAPRRARQRDRVRGDVRRRGPDPHRPRARPGNGAKKTAERRLRLAGRALARRRSRASCCAGVACYQLIRGVRRSSSTTRRRSRCRSPSTRLVHRARHDRPRSARGRLRARRRLPHQGGLRLQGERGDRARRRPRRSCTTARTAHGCSAPSPPG